MTHDPLTMGQWVICTDPHDHLDLLTTDHGSMGHMH